MQTNFEDDTFSESLSLEDSFSYSSSFEDDTFSDSSEPVICHDAYNNFVSSYDVKCFISELEPLLPNMSYESDDSDKETDNHVSEDDSDTELISSCETSELLSSYETEIDLQDEYKEMCQNYYKWQENKLYSGYDCYEIDEMDAKEDKVEEIKEASEEVEEIKEASEEIKEASEEIKEEVEEIKEEVEEIKEASEEVDETEAEYKHEFDILNRIIELKDYRRFGNYFKVKHFNTWKTECSVDEFVWNYGRIPYICDEFIDYVYNNVLDENKMLKWFVNINNDITKDKVFISDDYQYISEWLNNYPDESHAYSIDSFYKERKCNSGTYQITSCDGDLFNGLLVSKDDIEGINNISFILKYPKEELENEYQFVFTIKELKDKMIFIEDEYYYIPLFNHPVPIIFLNRHQIQCYIQIIYEEDCKPMGSDDVFWPLFTVCNKKYHDWMLSRTFVVNLNSNWLTINKDKVDMRF